MDALVDPLLQAVVKSSDLVGVEAKTVRRRMNDHLRGSLILDHTMDFDSVVRPRIAFPSSKSYDTSIRKVNIRVVPSDPKVNPVMIFIPPEHVDYCEQKR